MAYIFSLFAAILWGAADYIGGLQSRKLAVAKVMTVSQACGALTLVIVMIVAKMGLPGTALEILLSLTCGLCTMIGVGCLYFVMSQGAMILIAPVASLAAIVPVLYGFLTGERLDGGHWLGIFISLAGSTMAAWESADSKQRFDTRIGLGVLGAVVGTSGYLVLMRTAGHSSPLGATLLARTGSVLIGSILLLAGLGAQKSIRLQQRGMRRTWLLVGLMGVFDAIAGACYATATRHGGAGLVGVVSSMYPAFTVALTLVILREKARWYQLAGIGLAIAGIALLA